MTQNRTLSILQRVSVILAVTAASYGLQVQQTPRITANPSGGTGSAPSTANSLARTANR
jgi:hypothetical protein